MGIVDQTRCAAVAWKGTAPTSSKVLGLKICFLSPAAFISCSGRRIEASPLPNKDERQASMCASVQNTARDDPAAVETLQ